MDPFIGQIIMFGGNFAPRGWAFCDGQLLAISQNTALFSILGTTYGGDGRTTFGLPDLRGRVAMHAGNGPGLSDRRLGAKAGTQTTTLTVNEMPPHNHRFRAEVAAADQSNPTDNLLAAPPSAIYHPQSAADEVLMHNDSITSVGSGQSFSNEQPYQVVNFIIALTGTFPSRN